jgi:FKBP-type peptidyl-prolyl cis-trans isomerase 2
MIFFRFFIAICCVGLLMLSCATSEPPTELPENDGADTGRGLNYTCRMPDGAVVVTTDSAVADSPSIIKADVFIEKQSYAPFDIADLDLDRLNAGKEQLRFLEEVVVIELAKEIREWPIETAETLVLETKAQNGLPESERVIQIARVKEHPKMTVYAKNVFSRITGSELAIGADVYLHQGVRGKVVSVEENEVRVAFEPESDAPIQGPFGPIIVQDKGDYYRIEIDAQKGRLVRVGPAVGRIAAVNDRTFRIDYSHPFGGETLTCDTEIVAIEKRQVPATQVATITEPGIRPAAVADTAQNAGDSKVRANPKTTAESGDLAKVVFTAFLKSGELVYTTRSDVAEDPKLEKIEGYQAPDSFGPKTVLVGGEDGFPGVAEAVEGMGLGAHKKVTVPAVKVFGDRKPQLMRQFDRTRIVPTRVTLPAQQYVKQFGKFPLEDKTVAFNPYTVGRVVDVNEQGAVLELSPVEPEIESDFGITRMQVIDDQIHIHLTPKLGADFELEKKKGKVVAVDNRQFTVDFNAPLAGEDVKLDVQVIALTKASRYEGMDIHWIEDYEEGLTIAEQHGKPAVLVLYADWCGYSKKLFNTTLVDPRIRMMRDEFVWVKVDSHKQQDLKEFYDQKGFPLTVLLNARGEVMSTVPGYKEPSSFSLELQKALNEPTGDSQLKARRMEAAEG